MRRTIFPTSICLGLPLRRHPQSHSPMPNAAKRLQRQAEIKNAQNRKKSRRQLEEEARAEGLRQSLFERARAEEQERGTQNKAMSMMLKMGFKPGESLGRSADDSGQSTRAGPSMTPAPSSIPAPARQVDDSIDLLTTKETGLQHRTVPLAVDVWSGKKGVGLGKRAPSPGVAERLAKVARLDEEMGKETYRSRTREEYVERQAIGRLVNATRTLLTLDEKAGIQFNVLSLSPQDLTTIPSELLEALADDALVSQNVRVSGDQETENTRLKQQMQFDALQPVDELTAGDAPGDLESEQTKPPPPKDAPLPLSLSDEFVEEAKAFLQLSARDRLARVLRYLREKHSYCFWCGTQYNDSEDLDSNCPGEDEDAHD
ncbi:hypothetical protein DFH11DRAFT_339576 [Phellopilus nigrolimitatus]|nr:hypothetical protein DFH11DRAFT_339576 [Phellopilus nigrolimitatus]